jgi:hypothetical protein
MSLGFFVIFEGFAFALLGIKPGHHACYASAVPLNYPTLDNILCVVSSNKLKQWNCCSSQQCANV